jgi:hypothetical protein
VIGAKDRYIELVTELLFRRALADDKLPEEDEASCVDELDRCWWAMSRREQDEVEPGGSRPLPITARRSPSSGPAAALARHG